MKNPGRQTAPDQQCQDTEKHHWNIDHHIWGDP
jgi:hypothetical protein